MAVILPSVYKDGTATVAAGSKAVTGQGTMFVNTILPGDFFGTHAGFPNRVETVNSNTSLTLAYNWQGPAQTASAYEIMYQGDNARMTETTRQMLEQLRGGNVIALAGLVGAADQVPYFTGAGTMDKTSLSPWIRTNVLGKTDRATLLAALAVSENVNGVCTVVSDFDAADTNGWFTGPASALNSPDPTLPFYVRTTRATSLVLAQEAFIAGAINHRRWQRGRASTGAYSAWVEQSIAPPVGSVTNTAGFSAIIERGVTASGFFTRFIDGTAIGTTIIDETASAWTTASGGVFTRSAFLLVTAPTGFVVDTGLQPSVMGFATTSTSVFASGCATRNISGAACNMVPWASIALGAGVVKGVGATWIGRWK